MGMTRSARTFWVRVAGGALPLAAAMAVAVAVVIAGAPAAKPGPVPAGTPDLGAQADELLKSYLKKMGEGYAGQVDRDRHIVYVSALDEEHLRQTRELLVSYMDAQARTLLDTRLPWNLTVVLPTVDDYKKLVANPVAVGLYEPKLRQLTAIDRGRVLLHEFTHALHHADQSAAAQAHPPWVGEGLASLFESSRITPAGLEPNTDLRLLALHRAIRDKKTIPLDSLFKMGQKRFMEQTDLAYAQSRYFMLYLHEKGRLRDWYKRYKQTFADDPTGQKAVEAILNNKLSTIESEWLEWAAALKPPPPPARSRQSRLGVEVMDDPAGVKVVRLIAGGPAKQAGRIQAGDVIQEINGRKVTNTADFAVAVKAVGSMQTVTVKVLHQGRPETILQPLDSAPATPPATPVGPATPSAPGNRPPPSSW